MQKRAILLVLQGRIRNMWNQFMSLLGDYTFQVVALGCALLGLVSGVVGCFAVLRKQSLLGDGISHSALPGVAFAFLLTFNKKTEILLFGALLSGLLAAFLIIGVTKNGRIKFDTALALIMSVFFGFGQVLLTVLQKLPASNQAGISKFILGQASSLLVSDVWLTGICGGVILVIILLFWKEFKVFSFDPEFAETIGFQSRRLSIMLTMLIVPTIIIGLQTVGVILMSSMIVAPAVAARQWTDRLWVMALLSGIFGAFSGVAGSLISSSVSRMPTGPSIVLVASLLVAISTLFAPNRGMIAKYFRSRANRSAQEEVL